MILNLNKDFFLGCFFWYLALNYCFNTVKGILGVDIPKTYSVIDSFLMATLCVGWIFA